MSAIEPPPRGRPRSRVVDEAVTRAAWESLAQDGARAFSLERVAARAGVAVTTVYRRFPSADHLLVALYDQVYDEVPVADTGSVRADLADLMVRVARTWAPAERRRGLLVAVIAAQEDNVEVARAFADQLRRRRALTTLIVTRGIARGEVRPDADPELVMEVLAGLALQRLVASRSGLTEAEALAVVDLVLGGIVASPPVGRAP